MTSENLPAKHTPNDVEWERIRRMASMVAGSGVGPDSLGRDGVKFMAIMLKGRELGIAPMQALEHIVIVKGKPTMSAELMRDLIYQAGHKLRLIELNNEKCTYEGRRRDDPGHSYRETFTMEDAKRAGIVNQTWNKFPKNMLAARATTNIARLMFADAIMGVGYTPDELGGHAHPDDLPDGADVPVADVAEDVEEAITVSEDELDDPWTGRGLETQETADEEAIMRQHALDDESDDLKVADDPEPTLDRVRVAEIEDLSTRIWGEARAVETQVMRGKKLENMNPDAFEPLKAKLIEVLGRKNRAHASVDGFSNEGKRDRPDGEDEQTTHPDETEGVERGGANRADLPATTRQLDYLQSILVGLNDEIDPWEAFKNASGIERGDLTRGQAQEWIHRLMPTELETGPGD